MDRTRVVDHPLSYRQAQDRLCALAQPLGMERIATGEALGRCLTEHIIAKRSQPSADLSAMDGYAVGADDCAGPWRIIGESAAGHPFDGNLGKGEAIRISTGALMPHGGGAVLLQENALREGDQLSVSGDDLATPSHIRRKGMDFSEGDELIARSNWLNPARIAVALSAGFGTVEVGLKPSLAIIDSGDELASDPEQARAHQIPATNGAMLGAMASPFAREIRRIGPVADTMDSLLGALEACADANVIVTSGGVSVGDHDLVRPALENWGAKIDFWRIAMKPGKPMLVATKGSQIVLGLPGNPVSSYVTAFLFLLPLLRKLSGDRLPRPRTRQLVISHRMPEGGPRAEFLRAEMLGSRVHALPVQDSSALLTLSRANAFIVREENAPPIEAGELVSVYLLQNGGIA